MYVRMTRRFDVTRSVKTFRKINFEVFYEDLLKLMAAVKYPKLSLEEAEDRLFEKYIYPNLVHNLPYLGHLEGPKPRKVNPMLLFLAGAQTNPVVPPVSRENLSRPQEGRMTAQGVFSLMGSEGQKSKEGLPMEIKDLETAGISVKIGLQPKQPGTMEPGNEKSEGNIEKTLDTNTEKRRNVSHATTWAPNITHTTDVQGEVLASDIRVKELTGTETNTEEIHENPHWIEKFDSCLDRCLAGFSVKLMDCLAFLRVLCKLLGQCLFPYELQADRQLREGEDLDLLSIENQVIDRLKSPPWSDLCHLISTSFTFFLEEGRKVLHSKPMQTMELNSENLIAIFSNVTDVISLASIAFVKQVGWSDKENIASYSSETVLAETSYWTLNYWVCFAFCMSFLAISYPAIRLARAGRYGVSQDMRPVSMLSWTGLLSRAVSLLAVSLYMTIMKTQLDALSCIYYESTDQWLLIRNSDIECFSSTHAVYFSLSILAIAIYYPLATLLYPTIQYQNKGLDLKYDTTYVVLESQGKLTMTGFIAFLPREKYLKLQLIACICVTSILSIIVIKLKPCLVKSYNLWKAGGFVLVAWCAFWALMNVVSGGEVFCLVLLVVGVAGIVGALGIMQWKLYGWTFRRMRA